MESQALYRDVGRFLAEHGLWPTPQNYALIYQLFVDASSPAAQAVRAATSDGVRLTQRDADQIMGEHGMPKNPAPQQDSQSAALLSATRRQVEEFTAIVEASQAQAKSYGQDLEAGAQQLEEAGDGAQVATLINITRAMVQRTRSAEQQLSAARTEAEGLRSKLAEVSEEARSDPLTQLPNRRAFEERLQQLQERDLPLSLAICDVDKFKRINDTYGHGVGDRVLRTIASLLRETCEGHMVARLGGEEFVVLFEGLEPQQAAVILDEARETLAEKKFRLRETDAPIGQVTFSAGVARRAHPLGTPALQRADELLYSAKNGGRNQVRFEPAN
jgi:diguanylate cyclase